LQLQTEHVSGVRNSWSARSQVSRSER